MAKLIFIKNYKKPVVQFDSTGTPVATNDHYKINDEVQAQICCISSISTRNLTRNCD